MCEVCGGTGLVQAIETETGGWRCKGLNGPARCNRPKRVGIAWTRRYGQVRTGAAECPLCSRREIKRSGTEEHGWNVV